MSWPWDGARAGAGGSLGLAGTGQLHHRLSGARSALSLAGEWSVDSEITFSYHQKVPETSPHRQPGLPLQTPWAMTALPWAPPEGPRPLQQLPCLPSTPVTAPGQEGEGCSWPPGPSAEPQGAAWRNRSGGGEHGEQHEGQGLPTSSPPRAHRLHPPPGHGQERNVHTSRGMLRVPAKPWPEATDRGQPWPYSHSPMRVFGPRCPVSW